MQVTKLQIKLLKIYKFFPIILLLKNFRKSLLLGVKLSFQIKVKDDNYKEV